MKIVKDTRGQFIIIAVMIIAIMMVSIAVTMYGAATYYEYERWEEYKTVIDHLKLNTVRLVEMSLANYTTAIEDEGILRANLARWELDLREAYPGLGIILTYELANGAHQTYDTNSTYILGLTHSWNAPASFSAANATFTLDLAAIGLTGYRFDAAPLLGFTILNRSATEIYAVVKGEDGLPITDLKEDNFLVSGLTVTRVSSHYDKAELLVYKIQCDGNIPASVAVTVWDTRGIRTVAESA